MRALSKLPVKTPRPLPRVRHEPPTIEEALFAARDLSADPAIQVEIAAGLMGISEDEVRPHLRTASSRSTTIIAGRRSVIVEQKVRRRAVG